MLLTNFKLKTEDGRNIIVNKAVIGAGSPVLLSIFREETNRCFAEVPFDFIVMKELVRFIYFREVENLPSIAHKLIYAADKYQVEELKNICVDAIKSSLSIENVLESLVVAERITGTKNLFFDCFNLIFR